MTACPTCGSDLDTPADNDALANDEYNDYFCPRCGSLFTAEEVPDGAE